jgi:hypothetical protein
MLWRISRALGAGNLQNRRTDANKLTKQVQATEERCPLAWGLDVGLQPVNLKMLHVKKTLQKPQNWSNYFFRKLTNSMEKSPCKINGQLASQEIPRHLWFITQFIGFVPVIECYLHVC